MQKVELVQQEIPMPIRAMYGKEICTLTSEPKWPDPGKVVITAAVTGAFFSKNENPNQPYTTLEILDECLKCAQIGPSSIHIHVRDERTGFPSGDMGLYRKVIPPLKKKYPDMVVDGCLTRGTNFEDMMAPAEMLEVSPLNPGAMWFSDTLLACPPPEEQAKARYLQDLGVKPQIAVYDTGHIDNAERWLIRTGILEKPYYWIILPALPGCGTVSNIASAMELLLLMVRRIREIDPESVFMTCAAGRASTYLAVVSMLLGGHVRVGMEDTIFKYPFKDERIASNAEEVMRAKRIAEDLGRTVATPDDYRKLVGIGSR